MRTSGLKNPEFSFKRQPYNSSNELFYLLAGTLVALDELLLPPIGKPTGQQHASANESKRIMQKAVINNIHLFTGVSSLSA